MFRLALHRIGLGNITRKIKGIQLNTFCVSTFGPKKVNFEPEYLDDLKPEIPLYDEVNVQLKGYDYPLLESYQKFVHKLAVSLDIDSGESWALPAQKLVITRTEPGSSVVDTTYHLSIYERNVQIVDVPSNIMPIFVEAIQTGLPEGVNMQVHVHTSQHDEDRFVPDLELKELEKTLEEMGGPREVKPMKRK